MMKAVDANTAALLSAVASGQHFPEATFTAQWGTASSAATISYRLQNVVVESLQHSGGGGGAPTESLSLSYTAVTWTYKDASGTTSGSWDLIANTP